MKHCPDRACAFYDVSMEDACAYGEPPTACMKDKQALIEELEKILVTFANYCFAENSPVAQRGMEILRLLKGA